MIRTTILCDSCGAELKGKQVIRAKRDHSLFFCESCVHFFIRKAPMRMSVDDFEWVTTEQAVTDWVRKEHMI